MASNNPYQDILRAKVASAISQAQSIRNQLTHPGVKGSILEILIGQLFQPLLPADIGVGTGQIIESYTGQVSGQMDIVLYDKSILPPVLIDQKLGIFPIESVLYTIEVKTVLTAAELRTAHEAAAELETKFFYRPGKADQNGKEQNHKVSRARSVIFALSTDLSGKNLTEAERYRKLYENGSSPHLRAICVAGSGYWYDNGDNWLGFPPTSQYDEVLAFIGGVTNTYREVANSRGQPSLGHYIVPDAVGVTATKSWDYIEIPVECSGCGFKGTTIPKSDIENMECTGALVLKGQCPECAGDLVTPRACYKFIRKRLVEMTEAPPEEENPA